jgi:beta-mannosidase
MKLNLNGGWQLTNKPLNWGPESAAQVQRQEGDWLACDLPCDIHVPLIREHIIPEPLLAEHWKDCRWTEDRSWWFRKTFMVDDSLREADCVVLSVEGIDCHADLFLNGVVLGHHESAFYPFQKIVKDLLVDGENMLLIRVTSGYEEVCGAQLAAINHQVCAEYKTRPLDRGDERRAFVRKPQYVAGWDWGPRVVTCGIMGDMYIEASNILTTDVIIEPDPGGYNRGE